MEKPKMLIIDDEREFLDFLKEELEIREYDVAVACDGQEGLAKIKEYKPDMIICDFKMPKKDGLKVLKELREGGDTKTPFIMLTAMDDFTKTRESYDNQASLYLTKPFQLPVLLKNIQLFLELAPNRLG